ncbi:high mobility group box domain-containing protein [Coprinopsis sp. MPI-PUGE-AT-0042]|nr:high mobility group box domain-containing protein [Coprinopsis sp. MPI-PUGE-AT-0042]
MPKVSEKPKRKAAEKAEKAPRAAAAKGGKKGAEKDPNKPKRPLSAYMYFSQDWRERIKTENPEAGFGEVGKLLGAKWKELDEEEKKPYVELANKDKQRAEDEKAAYKAPAKKASRAASSGEGDEHEDDE